MPGPSSQGRSSRGSVLSRLHGEQPAPDSVRILTIDGGGVRGIIPAVVLGEFEKRTGHHPSELFDVIAGTSTGSLLAVSMTVPGADGRPRYQASSSADAYEEFAPKIFPREHWVQIRGLVREKYSAVGLETALRDFLGDTRFSDALVHTLVPTYDLMSQDIQVFDSVESGVNVDDDILMRHVVRGATAAPTYFDPFVIEPPISNHRRVLVDGGLYANNPSMLALTQVARHYADADVFVVSLGTGQTAAQATSDNGQEWGLAQWAKPLLHIVANGTNKVIDLELQHFLGSERYHRFQVELPEECDLDNATPENFQRLRKLAEDLVTKRSADLDRVCAHLLRS
jgi:patatin-like phospholipase/acyl hydrolase